MSVRRLAITGYGMVTSVGLDARVTAAAVRAGLSNPQETRFVDWGGEWIIGHAVPIEVPDGQDRIVRMAAMSIDECLSHSGIDRSVPLSLVMCVAETQRPGRPEGLDQRLLSALQRELGVVFSPRSLIVAEGRAGVVMGLQHARDLLYAHEADAVIVAGVDTYLSWPTVSSFENRARLLTSKNSNGFMPGEAGSAILVTRGERTADLWCVGLGLGSESATVESQMPLRADGLVRAVRTASEDAGGVDGRFEFRMADLSGEQYYFKEAALAMSRLVHLPHENADLWHPADCVGEVGAAVGPLVIGLAAIAYRKKYAPASALLCHFSSDYGIRAAAIFRSN